MGNMYIKLVLMNKLCTVNSVDTGKVQDVEMFVVAVRKVSWM